MYVLSIGMIMFDITNFKGLKVMHISTVNVLEMVTY